MDAEGNITRLSRDSFSSEEEFLYWKTWSDANYHAIENGNHLYSNHTLSLHLLPERAYVKENYDRINVNLPKGKKELVQAHAEAQGESLNGFINRAITETMERDNAATGSANG